MLRLSLFRLHLQRIGGLNLKVKRSFGVSHVSLRNQRRTDDEKIYVNSPHARKSGFQNTEMVRILNVAEKNDAAKSLSDLMSRGRYRKREGFSKFNKIYEFEYNILNQQNSTMTMTSVSGHLLGLEFVGQYRKWYSCNPVSLFEAQVEKACPEDFINIKRTLEREVRGCQSLIIWTDCDREGENIGFEIIDVCRAVKPNLRVYRARFSEITPMAVARAVNNLIEPDRNTSDAVDVRQELDLRIGAAFTRFQTLRLQKVFPDVLGDQLISYGSCQFPTLGFVVERYKQVQAFVPEPFWKIRVCHDTDDGAVEFNWKRVRLFQYTPCLVLYQHCLENPKAEVIEIKSKSKSKWRPQALDTVELEKLASRKLRINAKETMKIAEKLYTQGYISYPRTETNIFPKDLDLRRLVEYQAQDPRWGEFAAGLLEHGIHPRNGSKSDQAHPPIHPTKYAANLQGNEGKIYEFIVRHFLACCSQDAQGQETIVEIDIADERFSASGLMIIARNYLDVYPYEKWNAKVIPKFTQGEEFIPKSIDLDSGETSPPSLLSEADLIALMEKHGIGTDATHAEHIETIKSRMYVGVRPDGKFVPGELGMGLVEGYDAMGFEMSKPHLRAELEADLKLICEGQKQKDVVLAEQVQKYKEVFIEAAKQAIKIDTALSEYFGNAQPLNDQENLNIRIQMPVMKCPQCGQQMVLKTRKEGKGFYISCMGYPNCRNAIWLPEFVLEVEVTESVCDACVPGPVQRLKFKFKRGSVPPMIPLEYTGCVGGCDVDLNEIFNIKKPFSGNNSNNRQPSQSSVADSGYSSNSSFTTPTNSRNQSSHSSTTNSTFRMPNSQSNHNSERTTSSRQPLAPLRTLNTNMNNNRGSASASTGGEEGSSIVCNCGEDALLLTVKKEGPNTGRQFYKCNKPMGSGCDFFLWADQSDTGANSRTDAGGGHRGTGRGRGEQSRQNFGNQPGPSSMGVQCHCNTDSKLLTVNKEGPNKGRQFYACPKPIGQGCGFFKWADEVGDGGGHGGGLGGDGFAGRGRANSNVSRNVNNQDNKGVKRKRKCGLCGEEGHTRKTCMHAQ